MSDEKVSKSPLARLVELTWLDRGTVFTLSCYALAAGLLALAVPLAAQALVNTIAQGLFLQPLLVLTTAVFIGLLLAGVLKSLQFALAEQVQQRIFAQLGLRVAELLPQFRQRAFIRHNGPEELNKFFEIVNVQKSWNKLLLDIPTGLVELLISLLFLGFYGPSMLLMGGGVLALSLLGLLLLGYGGLRSSLRESQAKYKLAGWLEQVARCQDSVKLLGNQSHFLRQADEFIASYLHYRQSHFGVLLRQRAAFYLLNAGLGAGILGLGGMLVIERQISVGQLVAAEIVVLNLLKACERLVKAGEALFDLLTGLDKLGHLLEIPLEEARPSQPAELTRGSQLEFREVSFQHQERGPALLQHISFHLAPGERVSVVGEEGSGRSSLAQMAVGLIRPGRGQIEMEGLPIDTLNRNQMAWLTERDELFDSTVEENIRLGRDVSPLDLRWALEFSGLNDYLSWLPDGLKTVVHCGGRNLSRAQVLRILLARTVLARPHLLVVDQNFYSLDFERRIETVRKLFDRGQRWTLLNLVAETESLALSDRILWLHQGRLSDLGSPEHLLSQPDSEFATRFPRLISRLRRRLGDT